MRPRVPTLVRSMIERWEWMPDAFTARVEAVAREFFAVARLVWGTPPDDAQTNVPDHDAATLPRDKPR